MNPVIVYEDAYLVIVHKLTGIATQTKRVGESDLESQIRNHLKGGYVGLINRLDQQVEGLVLFAKTQEVAKELSNQMQTGKIEKSYQAIVVGAPKSYEVLEHYLLKDSRENKSSVVEKGRKNSKKATLEYKIIQQYEVQSTKENISLLLICLETGRHHQIRVQLAHEHMPIIGDFKYGNEVSNTIHRELNGKGIALCSTSLSFRHPISREKMEYTIEPNWMKLTEKLQMI